MPITRTRNLIALSNSPGGSAAAAKPATQAEIYDWLIESFD